MSNNQAKIQAGCAEIPAGVLKKRYFQDLKFVERSDTLRQLPSQSTCNRWKKDLPKDATTAIVAWRGVTHPPSQEMSRGQSALTSDQLREVGLLKNTPFVREAVSKTIVCAKALNAEAVVFRTPAEFSPSAVHRERVEQFFTEIATGVAFGAVTRVWQPEGLWELRSCAALANSIGITLACDPLSADPLSEPEEFFRNLGGEDAYFRISDLGRKRGTDHSSLYRLIEIANEYKRAWVVFSGPNMFRQAVGLHRILTQPETQ